MDQPDDGATFGSLLRAYRLHAGLTQEALAEQAGLSRRGIADLERGARSAAHRDTIERLATVLGLSEIQRDALQQASHRARVSSSRELRRNERDAPRHNLPVQPTSFVGRQPEQTHVARLLESKPLVTLVGPGGVGKTRLALAVSASVVDRFRDGVWLVELAPLRDPALVPESVASALGVQQRAEVDIAASLAAWLRSRQMLLVLDNCEHVLAGAAQLASQLLHSCPELRLLATSREVLGINGETVSRVDPLASPEFGRSAADVLQSEAAQLFAERASAAASDFSLTDQNAPGVVEVCQRLDGVPLALELAAARLRALSVEELAARLDQRFSLLTGGTRDVLPRHRTLRALVDWSYDLLAERERVVFEQLSVFRGGWTIDAAEAVCEPLGEAILDLLGRLVDKSLIQTEPQPDGSVRYRMLETLREYAAEQLHRSGKADEVQRRHALFFADIIVRRWGPFWFGENTERRLGSVARDYDNFRESLRWLVDHGESRAAERLAAALTTFWATSGRVEEARYWLEIVVQLSPDAPVSRGSRLRLFLMASLAQHLAISGNHAAALSRLEPLLPSIREYADPYVVSWAVSLVGLLTWILRHDLETARALCQEGLRLAEATGITANHTMVREGLARVELEAGQYARARQLYTENLAIDQLTRPRDIIGLARVHFADANYSAAAMLLEELTDHYHSSRGRVDAILALTVLSWTRLAQADAARALTAATQALVLVRDNLGSGTSIGHLLGPLEAVSMICAASGQSERALRLAASTAALRGSYTELLTPTPAENVLLERWIAAARRALGPRASDAAWAAGLALGPEAATNDALSTEIKTPTHTPPGALTPREREVMLLAARGLSNRQIGAALKIAEGTARIHVERTLEKLDLHSRAQLAAWVFQYDSNGAGVCLSPDANLEAHS